MLRFCNGEAMSITIRIKTQNTTVVRPHVSKTAVVTIKQVGPPGPAGNVETQNDSGYVYVYGNESTDGSIRLKRDGTVTNLELRVSGIWQLSSIMTGGGTVWLGHSVGMTGIGHHIATEAPDGHLHFHVHSEFENGLTTKESQVVDSFYYEEHMAVVPFEDGEWTGTSYEYDYPSVDHRLLKKVYFKTGAIAATDVVCIEIWKGADTAGPRVFMQEFPASTFQPANTEVSGEAQDYIEFKPGENYHVRIKSDAPFSLKTTADLLYPYTYADVSLVREDKLLQTTAYGDETYVWEKDEYLIQDRKIYVCNVTGVQIGTFEANSDLWHEIINEGTLTPFDKYNSTTGWITGGTISINAGDSDLIDITAGTMLRADYEDHENPVIHHASWPDQVGVDPGLTVLTGTMWIAMMSDEHGVPSVLTFSEEFNPIARREAAVIGRVWGRTETGSEVIGVLNYKHPAWGLQTAFQDYVLAMGSWNISGNEFSVAGGLVLNKSSGETYRYAAEPEVEGMENIHFDFTQNPVASYSYLVQGDVAGTTHAALDPDNYDNNGVKTAVPAGKWTVQEVWFYPVSGVVGVVYGQQLYSTRTEAELAIGHEVIVRNTATLSGAILRAHVVVLQGATDLTDNTQAIVHNTLTVGRGVGQSSASSADYWEMLNGYITPSEAAHSVLVQTGATLIVADMVPDRIWFGGTDGALDQDSKFSWDSSNTRLKIGSDTITDSNIANWKAHLTDTTDPHEVTAAQAGAIALTELAQPLGVATLDGGGKVPINQLPVTGMEYQGSWDASDNTPTLADGIGTAGHFYVVSTAGTYDFGSGDITFLLRDWVMYNGTIWEKLEQAGEVTSVNGYSGVVVLDAIDIGLGNLRDEAQSFKRTGTLIESYVAGDNLSIGGVLGVGTSGLGNKLTVKTGIANDGIYLLNAANAMRGRLAINTNDDGFFTLTDRNGLESVVFASEPGFNNFIKNGGSFGIGTSDMSTSLGDSRLKVVSPQTSFNAFAVENSIGQDLLWVRESADSDGSIHIFDKTQRQTILLTSDEAVSYIEYGNFGVGTNNPLDTFTVGGEIGIRPLTGTASLRFWGGETTAYTLYADGSDKFIVRDSTLGANRLIVDSAGLEIVDGTLEMGSGYPVIWGGASTSINGSSVGGAEYIKLQTAGAVRLTVENDGDVEINTGDLDVLLGDLNIVAGTINGIAANLTGILTLGEDGVTDGQINLLNSGLGSNYARIFTDSIGSLYLRAFEDDADILACIDSSGWFKVCDQADADLLTVDGATGDTWIKGDLAVGIAADSSYMLKVGGDTFFDGKLFVDELIEVLGTNETTSTLLEVTGNGLTTGSLAAFISNSSSTLTRTLVSILNDNAAATGTTVLSVIQDSTGLAMDVKGDIDISSGDLTLLSGDLTLSNGNIDVSTNETIGVAMTFTANSLTAGKIALFQSDSSSNGARELVHIHNNNGAAVNTTPLYISNNAGSKGATLIGCDLWLTDGNIGITAGGIILGEGDLSISDGSLYVTGGNVHVSSSELVLYGSPLSFMEYGGTTPTFTLPRMTTASRDALPTKTNGMIIYNTTTNKFEFYEDNAWHWPI